MATQQGLALVLRNIAWHSSEKVLRMFTGLVVGLWMARYLGPKQFGSLNYIMAWLGMFNAIAWLGVGEAAMRDMVRDRTDEGRILGSAFLIRLVGSLLAVASALAAAHWLGGFSSTQFMLLAILCIGVPFAEIPGGVWLWFASHTNIGPAVMGKNLAMILGALAKVGVILAGAGLIALTAIVALESVLAGVFLFTVYYLHGQRFSHWRFDAAHAWQMLRSGLPIILSALVVSLNAKVDQIMLGRLTSMTDVGIYSAALRFSEIWWVVPPMIVQTLAARYIYPKDLGPQLQTNVARIVAGMAMLSLLPCILLTVAGPELISLVLGKQYQGAGSVLMIHVWTAVLVFIDAPVNQYLLASNRQAQLVIKSVVLLSLNFALALTLIPAYGPQGAAMGILIAQGITVLLLPVFYSPLRDLFRIFQMAAHEVPVLLRAGARLVSRQLSRK
jgi:polysaccharide transporter, PST family